MLAIILDILLWIVLVLLSLILAVLIIPSQFAINYLDGDYKITVWLFTIFPVFRYKPSNSQDDDSKLTLEEVIERHSRVVADEDTGDNAASASNNNCKLPAKRDATATSAAEPKSVAGSKVQSTKRNSLPTKPVTAKIDAKAKRKAAVNDNVNTIQQMAHTAAEKHADEAPSKRQVEKDMAILDQISSFFKNLRGFKLPKFNPRDIMDWWQTLNDILPYIGKSLRWLLRKITIKKCHIGCIITGNDPYKTGEKSGRLSAAAYSTYPLLCHIFKVRQFKFVAVPHFTRSSDSIAADVTIKLAPITFIGVLLHFLIHGGKTLFNAPVMGK